MRMRKKKNRESRIERCDELLIHEPFPKSKWNNVFNNQNPIYMEIGCGKGGFITGLALQNPDINFIAIEKCVDVIILALEKTKNLGINNIKFILGDATILEDIIAPGELCRIYINFCDPWHKSKHAKRRLTHSNFLNMYRNLLEPVHGELHFKTDNAQLFEFSLNEFSNDNLKLRNITLDLHKSNFDGNIMTEYETLFSQQGMPIYRCEVLF